jgi:long-chain acyl-CoA synthetase
MGNTLAQIIENLHARGTGIAYVQRYGYRTSRWSYRQVAESARRLAKELLERGVSPQDRVFLWGKDCAEWVIAFFACVLRGAVVVPMDRVASPQFAARVCHQVNAKLCICSYDQPQIAPSLNTISFESFPEVLARHSSSPLPLPSLSSNETVEIVFTSGTTADPKGVILTHKNIMTNLEPLDREIQKYLKYERLVHPLRFLNLLPLSHVFGQFLGLFIPQLLGSTVVFQETLNPSEIIRTIKKERVSVLVTVPRILDSIRTKLERDLELDGALDQFQRQFRVSADVHFLKRWWRFRKIHRQFGWKFWAIISGGASLNATSERFWGRLGFAVIQGYGLTETSSLISINHPFKPGKGSIGRILPGRELKLAADGEILVRGNSIAKSYYRVRESTPISGEEGWFHTGDIGALDKEGNLYFKGRKKNVIVSPEGINIYPEDLEAALRIQPEVRDCVVLGWEHEGNAEPCAVLILQDQHQNPETVVQRANASLAEFQHIRRWFLWPEEDFPRTSTQKVQSALIHDFVYSQSAGIDMESGSGTIAALIRRITGRNIKSISQDTDLAKELNLSSIERVELLSALEDRFQIDLDEPNFTAAKTIGDLEKALSCPAGRRNDFRYPRWIQSVPIAALRMLVYYLVTWPAMMVMACPRIRGRENVRNVREPVLFVANHITQVDVGFIMAALPPRFRHHLAVAMKGEMLLDMRHPPQDAGFLQKWIQKLSYWLVGALFNVFPLPQQTGYRESFVFAGESADRGYSILVFPEGMRTKDGKMNRFRAGIGILAINLNLPVIPIRIDGLYELKRSGKKYSRPGKIRVTIGSAVRYDRGTEASRIALDLETRLRSMETIP